MIPKKVTLENFLSFGPKTEIAFDDDEALWVLGGPNGVGKSAVFDAMTFCLFGLHRGGLKEIDPLVRHGANGFSVSFEFEFNGILYRITRNRTSRRTTQSVEQQRDGTWTRVPNINSIKEVTDWSERTLGLNAKAFQSSVLLRQGEAEEMLRAGPTERFKILRSIVGGERYEDLSVRVNEATKFQVDALRKLQQQRGNAVEVILEQVAAAEARECGALAAKTEAATRAQDAFARQGAAKTWNDLQAQASGLDRKINEAQGRAAAAEQIRIEHARFEELERVLPVLTQLKVQEEALDGLDRQLGELRRVADEATRHLQEVTDQLDRTKEAAKLLDDTAIECEREASALRKEIGPKSLFRESALKLDALRKQLLAFPESFDTDLSRTLERHTAATQMQQQARDEVSRLKGLVHQATDQQRKFDSLTVGIPCSACGQPVTPEHAEKERRLAAGTVQRLTEEHRLAQATATEAASEVTNEEKQRNAIQARVKERNELRQSLDTQTQSLEALGGSADVDALSQQLADLTAKAEQHEARRDEARRQLAPLTTEETRLTAELPRATKAATNATKRRDDADKQASLARMNCDALCQQLPASWQATRAAELDPLVADQARLRSAGIAERFAQLQRDATLLAEWRDQRTTVTQQCDAIPEAARVPQKDAEERYRLAKQAAERADEESQVARDGHQSLKRQYETFATLLRSIETAEKATRIHQKLNERLGKTGLQRELVREAEQQIVYHANNTVGQLSDGDLSIELDQSAKNDDEALALLVNRADDPEPTPVEYLSGSQKFRVAVALALAIGRFAAGQARPIECVIIDEGFGSLDKEGLRATADELNRLKQHLRRIILVSHQDEFTELFPVVIRLRKTDHGTTAERIRR